MSFFNLQLSNFNNLVSVNFTNRGFNKVFNQIEQLSDTTPDKETILQMSELLSDVKVLRGEPTLFKTIPEFLGVDYIGYIIEKERLDKQTGEWLKIDEYKIVGSNAGSFIDTRVAYGQAYRYRIKTVIKVSKSKKIFGLSHLELVEDLIKFEAARVKGALEKKAVAIDQLDRFTNLGVFGKRSTGQILKEIELVTGIDLVADDSTTSLVKESLQTIENLRSLQNLAVVDIDLIRGSATNTDLQRIINENLEKFQEFKTEYFSSYYESKPSKNWTYVDVVENIPPPPPQTIKVVPNTPKRQISIYWLQPANDQRDIQYFKIYRRNAVGERWQLLSQTREIDIDEDGFPDPVDEAESRVVANTNMFVDRNVSLGRKYIYAMSCVDVHGIESFLSMQIQAELNSNYALEKIEKPLKWISGSGARPDEVKFILKKFLNRTENIIAKTNLVLRPNTKFAEVSKDLIIRLISLDTHEVKELKVVLKNTNLNLTS